MHAVTATRFNLLLKISGSHEVEWLPCVSLLTTYSLHNASTASLQAETVTWLSYLICALILISGTGKESQTDV